MKTPQENPSIVSVRFKMSEVDAKAMVNNRGGQLDMPNKAVNPSGGSGGF